MATWFGKYDFQGIVNDRNSISSSSDNTDKIKNSTLYYDIRTKVTSGSLGNNYSYVDVNADGTLKSTSNHDMYLRLNKGQFNYFQDVSVNNAPEFFSSYTVTLNPDPCDPQVVDICNIDFTNVDISNAYSGMILWDDVNNVAIDSSLSEIYKYAEINNNMLDTSANVYDFSGTRQELIQQKKMFSYPYPVHFGDYPC